MLTHRKLDGVRFVVLAAITCLTVSLLTPALALDGSPVGDESDDHPYTISVNVGLVLLPVFVSDRHGQAVSGLDQKDFRLYDDGRQRQITLFEPEDVPATVGLVVDNSGSMLAKRDEVAAAGMAFARSSNPRDQLFVVNFNGSVSLGLPADVPFTSNMEQLQKALATNSASGNTALYDGIAAALNHIKSGNRQRKALIVVSDGGDNSSTITLPELLKRAESANVVIHTIGIFDPSYKGDNPKVLRELAKMTGGNSYFPQSASEVTAICENIAQDVRHQYTIGYSPEGDSEGQYHAIRVTARAQGMRNLRVRTRAGYVLSAENSTPVPAPAGQ